MNELEDLESLKAELEEQISEIIQELSNHLEKSIQNENSNLKEFKGKLHTLKGAALSVKQTLCSDICHELESYLDRLTHGSKLEAKEIDHIYHFLDLIPDSIHDHEQDKIRSKLENLTSNTSEPEKLSTANLLYDLETVQDLGLNEPITPLNIQQKPLKGGQKLVYEIALTENVREEIREILWDFDMPLVSLKDIGQLDHYLSSTNLDPCLLVCPQDFFISNIDVLESHKLSKLVLSDSHIELKQLAHFSVIKVDKISEQLKAFLYRIFNFGVSAPREGLLKKILIADDNAINLKVAQKALQKMDFEVETAKNGEDALDKAIDGDYDFIILDLEMPNYSGLQAAHLLKINGVQAPIFAFSAHESQEIKDSVLSIAMDGWLNKPLNREDLLNILNRFQLQPAS